VCWSSELNVFVAVFESGSHRVMISSDGITWQIIEVSLNSWGDVAWSPQLGLYVAVADSGTGNRVMTSPDGTTWTDGSISDFSWDGILWSDLGYFLGIARDGYVAYSNEGFNWIESALSGTIRGGCWSKELGIFVIVGNDTIYTSSLKNRKPTNDNVFDNEYNSIDEDGTWNFNSLTTNSLTLSIIGDVDTAIQGKQDELSAGTNISIVDNVVSCDLTGSTNIYITGGVISTTGLQNESTGGTNITIVGDVVSCDLIGSTNIDITSGVISTTGLQNELTGGTNLSIVDDVVSCDLIGSTNIYITGGVISTTGLQNELTGGTNISIVGDVVSCDLTGSTNIDITGGVISTTGLQNEIITSTDLSCNSLNTNQLRVNEDLFFDAIVIRRPTGETGVADEYAIALYELQCWVNDTNTLYENSSSLVSYFAYWTDKEDEVAPSIAPNKLYDNDITFSGRIGSNAESRDDLVSSNYKKCPQNIHPANTIPCFI